MDDVRDARERGWAVDEGHYTVGTASVAVPVLNDAGHAAYALTATMFHAHFSLERAAELARELEQPARLLASTLPFQ
jgi:DNA-binding IclR family transcriptional regulator